MEPRDLIQLIRWIEFLILAVLGWLLISKYRTTQGKAFLWLSIPLFIWPLISFLLDALERAWLDDSVGLFNYAFLKNIIPYRWVMQGQITIGDALMYLDTIDRLVWLLLVLLAFYMLYVRKYAPGKNPQSPP